MNTSSSSLPILNELPVPTISTTDNEYEYFEDNVRNSAIIFLSELHMNTNMTNTYMTNSSNYHT